MNKTLLLILCDFLLLTLLALTDWKHIDAARPEPAATTAPSTPSAGAATPDDDLVAVMQLALTDEQARREQLAQELDNTEQTLAEREKNLTQLDATLDQTRAQAAQLRQQLDTTAADATRTKEQAEALARQLAEREAEARRQAAELAKLEQAQTEARQKIEDLNVTVRVAEQEKAMLRETTVALKEQVDAEREERRKVQASNVQLAQGVGQLADQSASLTREFRESQPINANTLFNAYLANRLTARFQAKRDSFFGPIVRDRAASTVLVTDGQATYALLHIEDTPFSLGEPGADWAGLTATLGKDSRAVAIPRLEFLKADPRAVGLPVPPELADRFGVKVYQTALDPYRFPDALLIAKDGRAYGEVPFKLDPANPGYVKMDTRLVRKLFADYNPGRGDLVLSKTGELLGIMVNADYCAVVGAFAANAALPVGDDLSGTPTGPLLDAQAARRAALPMPLRMP
ncbi:MAG: hypothetical protein ABII82_05345 [Verrucomicrobiota bacterium]